MGINRLSDVGFFNGVRLLPEAAARARIVWQLFVDICTCAGIGVFLAGGLAGCSAGGMPPVTDRSRVVNTAVASGDYVVVAGDTLYSIAWRHQRDFRELAALNRIRKPYDIYPGQRLQVRGKAQARSTRDTARQSAPQVAPQTTQETENKAPGRRVAQTNSGDKPHPLSTTQPKPQAGYRPAKKPTSSARVASVAKPRVRSTGPVAMRWPSKGKRLREFGEQQAGAQKPSASIDFLLSPGASIRAAAAGEVVYVGQALAGFEQFVIVKHNDTWLSAYGFNAISSVKEKQRLDRGAVLATLASTSNGSHRQRELHFELRKNGLPVNPATVIN